MNTKISKNKISILFIVVIVFLAMLVFCACSTNTVKKIEKSGFPNTAAESATISDKYKDVSAEITNDAIEEYLAFSGIPHPSKHEEALRIYLVDWAKKHGFAPVEGPAGCMYFDVAATAGCEKVPNVILQAHLDMVVATEDNLEPPDPLSVKIEVVKDESNGTLHAKDFKTNCGADDGYGIGLLLAIAKNQKITHGPLRMLFTTSEEIGCQGSKFVPAEFLNADYLINIDGGRTGEVDISSAGYMNADYSKTYQTTSVAPDKSILSVNITDLIGGHSGIDIAKPRKSAVAVIYDILNEASQIDPQFQIAFIESGTAYNAISNSAEMSIIVDASKCNEITDKINSVIDDVKKNNADEKDVKVDIKTDKPVSTALNNDDSKMIVSILKDMPNGLIKMSDLQEGAAESSANVGILSLINGNFKLSFSARSNNADYMETLKTSFIKIQNDHSLDYQVTEDSVVPVWPTDGNNFLSKLYLKALKEQCGLEGYESILHGAVEPARFVEAHPGMTAICIGCDIKDEHSIAEAWYTKSTPVTVTGILDVLNNINNKK